MYDNPYDSKGIYIQKDDDIKIRLKAKGETLFFDSRMPTQQEWDTCRCVTLTSEMKWDPHKVAFPCSSCEEEEDHRHSFVLSVGVLQITTLAGLLVLDDVPEWKTFIYKKKATDVSPTGLSEHWQTGLKWATQNLKVTTQRGARSAILPLACWYRAERMYLQIA